MTNGMSEEITDIIRQTAIKILDNSKPEKREENQELLNSIIEEIMATLTTLEKSMNEALTTIENPKK